eukprot:3788114-Pyramimonas_sp.AAC.1
MQLPPVQLSDPLSVDFREVMTNCEILWLGQYEALYPNRAYQLNQDPLSSHRMQSRVDGSLHTVMKNAGLIWAPGGSNGDQR